MKTREPYEALSDEELEHQRGLYHGSATQLVQSLIATIDRERAARVASEMECDLVHAQGKAAAERAAYVERKLAEAIEALEKLEQTNNTTISAHVRYALARLRSPQ